MGNFEKKVHPGMHIDVQTKDFTDVENIIIEKFSKEWYVTSGRAFNLHKSSKYKHILIKPTAEYKNSFNLEREIVVIFTEYDTFEPRTVDAVKYVESLYQILRIEKLCCIIISKDRNIVSKIDELVKTESESQILIPFSYDEILENFDDEYFLKNRFRTHFYKRDLFAYGSALKTDLYFFGRENIIPKLVDKHKSGENAALFGLRKTGKTSLIYGVKRMLEKDGYYSVIIDCQDPSFHQRRWNHVLWYIANEIKKQLVPELNLKSVNLFNTTDASLIFEEMLLVAKHKLGKSILLIFDEIENITFNTSPSNHWTTEKDFIFLWQSLRSISQKHANLFSYFIVGTNPSSVEESEILSLPNPIFKQITFEYIKSFDVPQTKDMVFTLGSIMGLKFQEIVYSKLTEDFGGHPFLIRCMCSYINEKTSDQDRPITIDKKTYELYRDEFYKNSGEYIEMILKVLKSFYPDEYLLLKYIALKDDENIKKHVEHMPKHVNHLQEYQIIDIGTEGYYFKIGLIEKHLQKEHEFEKPLVSIEEKYHEISKRRNIIEPKLRRILRQQLLIKYGKVEAKNRYISVDFKKQQYRNNEYEDLFDPNKCSIFWSDIKKAMERDYDIFENIFGNKKDFSTHMLRINNREDAHAKDVSDKELEELRQSFTYLEKKIEDFEK